MKLDLNTILGYFNNLNDQARYAVLTGVIFLILLLDVFLLLLPQMNGIANNNDQIKQLSADTQQVVVDKEQISVLKKNLQNERAQASSLSVKVRATQEVPAILGTISSIANEFGVKIDQLVPEKNQQEVLTSDADGKYYALPVLIRAHCGYHMFGQFLNKLENEDLYFILKDFIIQNDANDATTHLFSLTIKIILVDRAQTKNL